MSQEIMVSCRQIDPIVGEPERNRALIVSEAHQAASEGAQVVVFPELAPCGYSFESAAEVETVAEDADGDLIQEWAELSADLGIVIIAGYAEKASDGKLFNSAALLDPNGARANYRKTHLWGREPEYFSSGDKTPPVVQTSVGRIGVLVCYDLDFPEYVREVALSGAQLLCAPVNWPYFPYPDNALPTEMIRTQASAGVNRMAIAVCDRSGTDRSQAWLGGSQVVNSDGYSVTHPLIGTGGSVSAALNLSLSDVKSVGSYNHVFDDRRPELYRAILETQR